MVATIPDFPGYPEGLKSLGDGRLVASRSAAFGLAGTPENALIFIDPKTGHQQEVPFKDQNTVDEHAAVGLVVVDDNTVLVTTTAGPTTGGPEVIKFSQDDEGDWSQSYFTHYPGSPYTDIINGITVLEDDPLTVFVTDAARGRILVSPPGGGGEATNWLDASGSLPVIFPGQQMSLNAMVIRDGYVYVTFTGGPPPVDPATGAPLGFPFGAVEGKLYRVPLVGPRVLEEVYSFGMDMPDGLDFRGDDLWVTLASPASSRGDFARVDNLDSAGGATVTLFVDSAEIVMASDVTALDNVLTGPKYKKYIFGIGHNTLRIPTPSGNAFNVVKVCVSADAH